MNTTSIVKVDALKKVVQQKSLPVGAVDIISNITEMYSEYRKTKVEIERIRTQRTLLLEDIKQRYTLYNKIFDEIFLERRVAMQKMFDIIDRGIVTGNDTMIENGLKNLATVVTSSPFSNFESFADALQSGQALSLEE